MKINVDQVLQVYGKTPGKKEDLVDAATGEPILLRTVCINALMYFNPKEPEPINEEEKKRRGKIADKIFEGGDVELESAEIAKIEAIMGKFFPTLVYNAVYVLLEQKEEKK